MPRPKKPTQKIREAPAMPITEPAQPRTARRPHNNTSRKKSGGGLALFARFFISVFREGVQSARALDWVVAAAALLAVAAFAALFASGFAGGGSGAPVVEITAPSGAYVYNLSAARELVFDGPMGKTLVRIADGAVDVTESPGPLQICVNAEKISQPGQWLACLPNKVFIRIGGRAAQSSSASSVGDALSF